MVKLSDFADQRNVSRDTVAAYIRRNPEIFEGHTTKQKKALILDDEAVKMLDEMYPLPKPIQIIEDVESRQKLIQTQQLVIQLQQKIVDQTAIVAQAETMKVLLEDKEKQLEAAEKQLSDKQAELDAYRKEAEQQKEEINRLRSRSLWQRIRNV